MRRRCGSCGMRRRRSRRGGHYCSHACEDAAKVRRAFEREANPREFAVPDLNPFYTYADVMKAFGQQLAPSVDKVAAAMKEAIEHFGVAVKDLNVELARGTLTIEGSVIHTSTIREVHIASASAKAESADASKPESIS